MDLENEQYNDFDYMNDESPIEDDEYEYRDDVDELVSAYADVERVQRDTFFIGLEGEFWDKLKLYINQINNSSLRKKIVDVEIKAIVEKAKDTPNVEKYNPMGWILGFIGSKGGQKNMISYTLSVVLPITQTIEEVEYIDVIRYSRFWLSENGKEYEIEKTQNLNYRKNNWIMNLEDELLDDMEIDEDEMMDNLENILEDEGVNLQELEDEDEEDEMMIDEDELMNELENILEQEDGKDEKPMSPSLKHPYYIRDLANNKKWFDKIIDYTKKKFIPRRYWKKCGNKIVKALKSGQTDDEIIKEINRCYTEKNNTYNRERNESKAQSRYDRIIKDNVKIKPKTILDYGGQQGDTAAVFAKNMNIKNKADIFVIDIDEWAGREFIPRDDVTFYNPDQMINRIKPNSIDLIYSFHTLHHLTETERIIRIREFYNLLSPKGVLIIYEHDVTDGEDREAWDNFLTIMHMGFDTIVNKNISVREFKKTHFAHYYSIDEWKRLTENNNFKELNTVIEGSKDNSFYMFFKKTRR